MHFRFNLCIEIDSTKLQVRLFEKNKKKTTAANQTEPLSFPAHHVTRANRKAMVLLFFVVNILGFLCSCSCDREVGVETVGAQLLQRRFYKKSVVLDDDDGDDDDETPLPVFDNSPGQNGNGKPLSACQGSCSGDEDCLGDLVCITPKFVGWDAR